MKKTILAFFLLSVSYCVFAQNGILREVIGQVEIKSANSSAFAPANQGDQVGQDAVISTGFKSTALIEVGSAKIIVRPLTRMTLTEIQASLGTETINVSLQTGRIRVDVTPPAGSKAAMTVTSPIATASVRGTGFDFDGRNLFVNHGSVSLRGSRGIDRIVRTGNGSTIHSDSKSFDPHSDMKNGFVPAKPEGGGETTGGGSTNQSAPSNADTGNVNIGIIY